VACPLLQSSSGTNSHHAVAREQIKSGNVRGCWRGVSRLALAADHRREAGADQNPADQHHRRNRDGAEHEHDLRRPMFAPNPTPDLAKLAGPPRSLDYAVAGAGTEGVITLERAPLNYRRLGGCIPGPLIGQVLIHCMLAFAGEAASTITAP
jgi:hypothetical protein